MQQRCLYKVLSKCLKWKQFIIENYFLKYTQNKSTKNKTLFSYIISLNYQLNTWST